MVSTAQPPDETTRADAEGLEQRQAAWQEWQDRCALRRCGPDAAAVLAKFGEARYRHYGNRLAARSGASVQAVRPADQVHAWHLLETYARTGSGRTGKSYKCWLFARVPPSATPAAWLQAVEAGASLLMRDAVREQVRHEYAPAFMQELDRPVDGEGGAASPLTLAELLPAASDTFTAAAENECAQWAAEWAAWWLQEADRLTCIALWVRAQGWALHDPDVCEWAGCGKSALHKKHRADLERFCAAIRRAFPQEDSATWLAITQNSIEQALPLIYLKLSAEKAMARFLKNKGVTGLAGVASHA